MWDTISLSLQGAWQLFVDGLLLGAGLPILVAFGMRFWAGKAETAPDGTVVTTDPTGVQRAIAVLCFGIAALAVAMGIMIIVGAGFGMTVEFDGGLPSLVPKS